jgi:hypothetical protein
MLIESKRYQAEELSQIQASRVTIAKLQKSVGKEERRRRNSPELDQRLWNSGGERAEEDLISQQCRREVRRRRRRWCRTSANGGAGMQWGDGGGVPFPFLGPAVKRER